MARTIPMIQPVSQLLLLALVSTAGERERWMYKVQCFRNAKLRPHTFLFTFSIKTRLIGYLTHDTDWQSIGVKSTFNTVGILKGCAAVSCTQRERRSITQVICVINKSPNA